MKRGTITASEFKAKCLRVLEDLAASGESLTITRNGKPIAKITGLLPHRRPMMGRWEGQGKIKADLVTPAADGEWESAL